MKGAFLLRLQKFKHILVLYLLLHIVQQALHAQCTGGISTFPYVQDFEANNGGWTTGGTASDWAWGTPSKTVITGAGSGNKCWITGGLTGSTYNGGERSWLQSPCFDFTNLDYPQVSFLVFWETEYLWDGATFQYSTNNGVSWQNVGAAGASNFCLNANWFNSTPVSYLTGLATVRDGWSGSVAGNCVTGNGSGGWKQATYSIPALAGQPGVLFRFAFGAGTSCNTYDGFAIDKFQIGTTQANQAIFTYNCTSSNTVQFTNASTPCPNVFQWNFNDPASGAANTSTSPNPIHTFSGPGTYHVSLTVSDANGNNAPHTSYQTVIITDVNLQLTNAIKCYGDNNAEITATVTGGTGPFTYTWNTTPVQNTAVASGLGPGNYTVTIGGTNVCPVQKSLGVIQPMKLDFSTTVVNEDCMAENGSIQLNVTGGVPQYHYTWTPAGPDAALYSNLHTGFYSVTVTDANGCTKDSSNIEVKKNPNSLSLTATVTDQLCTAANGSIQLNVSGGTPAYHYVWTPAANDTSLNNHLTAGTYDVHIIDANGCVKDSVGIKVIQRQDILNIFLGNDTAICPGKIVVLSPGAYVSYLWQDNSTAPTFTVSQTGTYHVLVKDANGCMGSDAINVTVDCPDLFFPNAFSPNGDGNQDQFGPRGSAFNTTFYRLTIFNRWGQLIFESSNPLNKWNGTFKGQKQPAGTYIWRVDYQIPGQLPVTKNGLVVLMK